jgi:hypothetical protein
MQARMQGQTQGDRQGRLTTCAFFVSMEVDD